MDKQNVDEAPTDVEQTDVETPQEERTVKLAPEQLAEWGELAPVEPEVTEEKEEPEEVEQPEEKPAEIPPAPVEQAPENPGEYTPKDYSFDFELDGKTVKINSVEEAEAFAEENAEAFTAKQLLAFMNKSNKMSLSLERDKEKFDKAAAKYEELQESQKADIEATNSLAAEMEYLISKGKVPAASEELKNANWMDPEVSKQPGVKEQIELINYMRDENALRVKAGLKPMTSMIDAYNAWQLDQKSVEQVDLRRKQATDRKERSSRVAGVSPKPVNIAPKGYAIGRVLDLNSLDGF